MKKAILALFLLCLAIGLSACAENRAVVEGDYHAEPSDGAFTAESRHKNVTKPKDFTLFGKESSLYYSNTYSTPGGYYETDSYHSGVTFVDIRSDTGKVASFQTSPSYSKDYVSPVGEGATEEEYLAYAKSVLTDVAGVSPDGWDATVNIYSTKYADKRGYFVYRNGATLSLTEEDYEATVGTGVTVTFTKRIGEIERCDKLSVEMTGAGEIVSFSAINFDRAFAPFADVVPDRERIVQAAQTEFDQTFSVRYLSSNVDKILLKVNDGTLWAVVYISYVVGVENDIPVQGGVTISVEVAKIER